MRGSKGYRSGTRHLLKKEHKERGKIKMSKLLQEYQPGNRVVVRIDPSIQKGMPHRRFHGKTGTVTEKRGRSYVVTVPQGNAVKEIIVRPEHIEPFKGD
jgi:large subunit ribosomal protein L21e